MQQIHNIRCIGIYIVSVATQLSRRELHSGLGRAWKFAKVVEPEKGQYHRHVADFADGTNSDLRSELPASDLNVPARYSL